MHQFLYKHIFSFCLTDYIEYVNIICNNLLDGTDLRYYGKYKTSITSIFIDKPMYKISLTKGFREQI